MPLKARLDRGRVIINGHPHVFATWDALEFWLDIVRVHESDALRDSLRSSMQDVWRRQLQDLLPANDSLSRLADLAGKFWLTLGMGVMEINLEAPHRARIRWGHARLKQRDPMQLVAESFVEAFFGIVGVAPDDLDLQLVESHPSICFWEATWTSGS